MPSPETDRIEQPNVSPQHLGFGGLKAALLDLIGAAEPTEVSAVLDQLWSLGNLSVRQPPEAGLVMITVRDPFDTDFFLGEVLITKAEVVCDGIASHGIIMGEEPERALLLATIEALELSERKAALTTFGEFVARLKRSHLRRRQTASKMAAATTVCFESMKKEQVDFGSLGE
jgi:phosphonate C-P lyase system protein PhnG